MINLKILVSSLRRTIKISPSDSDKAETYEKEQETNHRELHRQKNQTRQENL